MINEVVNDRILKYENLILIFSFPSNFSNEAGKFPLDLKVV